MSPATAVFVGPTLHGWDPRSIGSAIELRPPARLGDLAAAAARGVRRLALIDGCFVDQLPPSPREILVLLDSGIEVFGAASLGALRAVELEAYGMRGHGWVFRQFRARRLYADDEVMVVFDADTGRPLSDALVNLRYALARHRELLPAGSPRRILREIRALYFPDRTQRRIAASVTAHAGARRARSFLSRYAALDIKRNDALSLLELLCDTSD